MADLEPACDLARRICVLLRNDLHEDRVEQLIEADRAAVSAARDAEWRAAYNGPGIGGPKSPEELRVFLDEAAQVNREQAEHDLTAVREPLERRVRELEGLVRKSREQVACGASPDGILSNLLGDIEALLRLSASKEGLR